METAFRNEENLLGPKTKLGEGSHPPPNWDNHAWYVDHERVKYFEDTCGKGFSAER
jgi:hypothetical protein